MKLEMSSRIVNVALTHSDDHFGESESKMSRRRHRTPFSQLWYNRHRICFFLSFNHLPMHVQLSHSNGSSTVFAKARSNSVV
jgi:hypothetical protein